MTRGERRAFERLLAAAVPPGDGLPPVAQTDAVAAFEAWLRGAPAPNRTALRVMLRAVARGDIAGRLESGKGRFAGATQVLTRVALHCYYGDRDVMRRLGYDAAAVAERGLALRRAEGRV